LRLGFLRSYRRPSASPATAGRCSWMSRAMLVESMNPDSPDEQRAW